MAPATKAAPPHLDGMAAALGQVALGQLVRAAAKLWETAFSISCQRISVETILTALCRKHHLLAIGSLLEHVP